MKRLIITMMLTLAGVCLLGAQEVESPKQPESRYEYEPIRSGDQYIRLGLGVNFPLFFTGPGGVETDTKLDMGGAGFIGFSRFITSHLSLGGELGFAFNATLGENMLVYVPLTFKITYELVYDRLHFPLSLSPGLGLQSYKSRNYFGLLLRPEVACFFQYSPEWSFGVSSAWDILPQWYDTSSDNRVGHFVNVVVGLRYHF
ncbi:MAG TPA: hypothetical protein PKH81_01350 [Treponemataceae bacterium]|mgnify:CR=1 FL=1|nr:hypothetical protein [Treponemataceae bacterium]